MKKTFTPLYLFALLHIISVYAFVPIFLSGDQSAADDSVSMTAYLPILMPALTGLLNLAAVLACRKTATREQLLCCTIAVKYALIPFFLMGGACIAIVLLLMFTPIVIMVFVAPVLAAMMAVTGWVAMIGAAPFSIGYLVRSRKDRTHPELMLIAAGICQFFFTADVISVVILAFKERRYVKLTVCVLLLLLLAAFGGIAWLIWTLIR